MFYVDPWQRGKSKRNVPALQSVDFSLIQPFFSIYNSNLIKLNKPGISKFVTAI